MALEIHQNVEKAVQNIQERPYTPTECFKLLNDIYGKDVMLRTQIFEWHKHFIKGRKEVEDDPKTRQPSTTRID